MQVGDKGDELWSHVPMPLHKSDRHSSKLSLIR